MTEDKMEWIRDTFSRLLPHNLEMPTARLDDSRLGHIVHHGLPYLESSDATDLYPVIAIVGFPSDAGVLHNGGRPGAALGPRAIRKHLYRLTPDAAGSIPMFLYLDMTWDLGDVPITGDVVKDQASLGATLAAIRMLWPEVVTIILGGGHETAYGHFLGFVDQDFGDHGFSDHHAPAPVTILNIDAHPDVRPVIDGQHHSGNPFRLALEHPSQCAQRYAVAGLNPHTTSTEHSYWIDDRNGTILWRHQTTSESVIELMATMTSPTMLTMDMDALDQSFAPGVSAPNANGLDTQTWLDIAQAAGSSPQVKSMDIVELSPPHDADGATARVAALTIWHFLKGVTMRPGG